MDSFELTQVVEEVQGDISKFDILHPLIIDKVYYWSYTIVGNEADAVDASQEAIIRIYNKIHTLKEPQYFNSWMYRVVKNSCYTFLRKRRRHEEEFIDSDDFNEGFESKVIEERRNALPKEAYELNAVKEIVAGFVDNLPRRQREIIILYYFEELKINEVANVLECSPSSVTSRLYAGRKNLEKQIFEYEEKHDTKLYNASILPILGFILKNQKEQLCSKQNFKFNNNFHKIYRWNTFKNFLLSNPMTIIMSVICIGLASIIIFSIDSNDSNDSNFNNLITDKLSYLDVKGYQYIESIDYNQNLTREKIEITITLKHDIEDNEIQCLYNNKQLQFIKSEHKIVFYAYQNGQYEIRVKNEEFNFEINNIDTYALELIGVYNNKNHLQLIVNDENNTMDYLNSYITYNKKKYNITSDLTINGIFSGKVEIVLFDNQGRFIRYNLDF
ncbi:MAG: RNA polymerase sigma factor [Coprobacillaceae bacterium]